jgi:hypothetical protein
LLRYFEAAFALVLQEAHCWTAAVISYRNSSLMELLNALPNFTLHRFWGRTTAVFVPGSLIVFSMLFWWTEVSKLCALVKKY